MPLIYEFWVGFIAALQKNVQVLTTSQESTALYNSLLESSFRSVIQHRRR
jgi:hypothetical protein